jgi:hypothetical protein
MKVKISDKHTVEYLNGYYMTYENAVRSPERKNAGEEYTCLPKTYAKIEEAVRVLKIEGEEEDLVRGGYSESYKDYQIREGKAFLKKQENLKKRKG